jgi:hypothetical protein
MVAQLSHVHGVMTVDTLFNNQVLVQALELLVKAEAEAVGQQPQLHKYQLVDLIRQQSLDTFNEC